jgi:membrane-bound metal-dependent hydrolase YbcI (DUF457 family)
MMGHSHAVSGALAWMAGAPAASAALDLGWGPGEYAVGALVCAGAAILPDLDHPSSTIARTFGPLSYAVSKLLNLIAGGHRQATHSFLFAFLAGAGAFAALTAFGNIAGLALVFFFASFAVKALHLAPKGSGISGWLAVVSEAAVLTFLADKYGPEEWSYLVPAIIIGSIVHLLGDCLTPEGVPYFWPWRYRFSLPIIAHTGNFLETRIITPLMTVALIAATWFALFDPIRKQVTG